MQFFMCLAAAMSLQAAVVSVPGEPGPLPAVVVPGPGRTVAARVEAPFPGLSASFSGAFRAGSEAAAPGLPAELAAPPERASGPESAAWAERSFAGLLGGSGGPVIAAPASGSLVLPDGLATFGPGIDLHAHLFMKEGLTWMFRGHFFDENLRAKDWRARFSSQINPASVNASGARVLVASLYAASRVFTPLGLRASVRRQAALARRFVAENPQWVIAGGPREAEQALASGRRVLILALEGAAGIMARPADIAEFFDLGIRIVTFLHLADDNLGGAALLGGCGGFLVNPLAALRAREIESDGRRVKVNPRGLTELGLRAAEDYASRGIWIDLSHASDAAQRALVPFLKEAGQPLLYTHTALRRYQGRERGIALEQLEEVGRTGGLVGLMPSPEFLKGTPAEEAGGVEAFTRQYNEAAAVIGRDGVVVGSDFNGAIPHLRPTRGSRELLGDRGLWSIAQEPALWLAMERGGALLPADHGSPLRRFLEAWRRVLKRG